MTWRERVVAARAVGEFSADDQKDAGYWMSCAVGEQHYAMPGVVVYVKPLDWFEGHLLPEDPGLRCLGDGPDGFCFAVQLNDFDKAERILDAIDDRVLQLKRGSA